MSEVCRVVCCVVGFYLFSFMIRHHKGIRTSLFSTILSFFSSDATSQCGVLHCASHSVRRIILFFLFFFFLVFSSSCMVFAEPFVVLVFHFENYRVQHEQSLQHFEEDDNDVECKSQWKLMFIADWLGLGRRLPWYRMYFSIFPLSSRKYFLLSINLRKLSKKWFTVHWILNFFPFFSGHYCTNTSSLYLSLYFFFPWK